MKAIFEVKASNGSSRPPLLFVRGAWHGAWCWKPLMDYFFEFKRLQDWAEKFGYDFLPLPEAAHSLLSEPEKFNFGKTIYGWLDQKTRNS